MQFDTQGSKRSEKSIKWLELLQWFKLYKKINNFNKIYSTYFVGKHILNNQLKFQLYALKTQRETDLKFNNDNLKKKKSLSRQFVNT